ncbi:hypothetical protein QCD83_13945, partial [Pseudomonas savastanoi pv. phaseolicola]|uniref:hypothetical protein n=1 Tax=Pseudomonas savastanoi TaxID=29438 RepID=UPI00243738DF
IGTLLLSLFTIAGAKISNPSWVNFQSAGWVSFQSAPTIQLVFGFCSPAVSVGEHWMTRFSQDAFIVYT